MKDENVDDPHVRGTKLPSDIYERRNIVVLEPENFTEAQKDSKRIVAMKQELNMIKEKNQTWELASRLKHKNVIGVKWVFRIKLNADGSINKTQGQTCREGVCSSILEFIFLKHLLMWLILI